MEKALVASDVGGHKELITDKKTGPNGNSLDVCTIWMTEFATGITKFITMYPDKRR